MKDNFDEIVEKYKASIFHICLGYTKTKQDAEDLFQESLINIWRGLRSFRNEATVYTWIYRVTVNTCLSSMRKKRIPTIAITDKNDIPQTEHPSSESFLILHQMIQQLPEKDKLIILLYLEELSYKDIASVLGISVSNVGVRINRIKQKLSNQSQHRG